MPTRLQKNLNTLYLIFFLIHIPVIFLVDTYPLYPPSLIGSTPSLSFLTTIRKYYVTTYRDRFFIEGLRPAWFVWYLWMELLLHVPVSVWAVGALWRDSARPSPATTTTTTPISTSLVLLLFSAQTALTTLTCIAESLGWSSYYSPAEMTSLMALYVPYFVFACVMGVDMYVRILSKVRVLEALAEERQERKRI